ncbi:SIMPL domain-containing protein [Candidatus Poribacteria bacterium]|nr:SIMPL domain-containing protein [Candidatus Poribacteria bacterium]
MIKRIYLLLIFVLLIAIVLNPSIVTAGNNEIKVKGYGKIIKQADIAYISFYLIGDGILLEDANKDVTNKVTELQKKLGESFKQIKNIEVVDVKIGEKEQRVWNPTEKDESSRPRIIKRMRLTTPPDSNIIQQIIDISIRNGALMKTPSLSFTPGESNNIIAYSITDFKAAEKEAIKAAIEDARQKAESIAELIGKKIGDIKSIDVHYSTENQAYGYPYRDEQTFPTKYTSIRFDSIEISNSVTITFNY